MSAFDLSYEELAPGLQHAFRRLGRHPGTGLDAYAAAALADTDLGTARRHLEALYDHYLLTEPVRGRYRLHDLIREHARALAGTDSPAETGHAFNRLSGYPLGVAGNADRQLTRYTRTGSASRPAWPAPVTFPDLDDSTQVLWWSRAERSNLLARLDRVSRDEADRPADDVCVIGAGVHAEHRLRFDHSDRCRKPASPCLYVGNLSELARRQTD